MTTTTTEETTTTSASAPAMTMKKWETGEGLGPRMAKAFNDALHKVSWAAKSVKTLRGIHGKPETQKDDGMVSVLLFGGPIHEQYTPKLLEVQMKHGHVVTAANYKGLVAELLGLATWFSQNPIIKDERVTQEAFDAKEAEYKQAVAEREQKDAEKAARVAILVGELRAKYPWAAGRRPAENLKTLLQQTFPGVLFSVRSDYNSLTVSWENGPTEKEVSAIGDQFRSGSFNGMTDSYDHNHGAHTAAWTQVLGTVQYASYSRSFDRQPIIDGLRTAGGCNWGEAGHDSIEQTAWRLIAQTSLPAGAEVTGVEHLPDVESGSGFESFYRITFKEGTPGQAQPAPVTGASGITFSRNVEKGGVEIRFPAKPDDATIQDVKAHGFRWSRFSGCWWAKETPAKLAYAQGLAGEVIAATGASTDEAAAIEDRLVEMEAFTR